ncbi:MAG: sensor histidine kinase [Chloroflexi bacterium]|nr:sensor histidine kinase [Chloroflexota bacterium]
MDIITVYFLYGLSFFSMGLAILLEVGRSSEQDFARALRSLAGFGLVHGTHEWLEMFLLIHPPMDASALSAWIGPGRVILLAVSFLFLIQFGARLVVGSTRARLAWQLLGVIALVWTVGLIWLFLTESPLQRLVAADVYTRYSLAIPGAALAAWGLFLQRQKFLQAGMSDFGRDVIIAAVAFGLYGGVGQLFAARSVVFPSGFLNADTFLAWFGFRIQLFRSVMACIAAVAIIRSLRAFEEETRRQIETLSQAQLAERRRLEELREELLRQTVRAQELERQRIARELHDEVGQTLTALGMGLRAISDNVVLHSERIPKQARELQGVVATGLFGLQNLITGLHPPQLDDFGLVAAVRWYAAQMGERTGVAVGVSSQGEEVELPLEVRTVLYRIVQECVTNVVRHAKTDRAEVQILFRGAEVSIHVEDKGCGFDVDMALTRREYPCWGLLGIQERAALVGGACVIRSEPGMGTLVEVMVPLERETHG